MFLSKAQIFQAPNKPRIFGKKVHFWSSNKQLLPLYAKMDEQSLKSDMLFKSCKHLQKFKTVTKITAKTNR